ncbi:MAG: fibronectin type III domain-containing protein [Verrucomicrobiota bacterium]
MPLSRQRREEIRSAAITQTPLLVLACSLIFGLTAFAADPSWWTNSGTGSQPAVMAEQRVTNNGVVSTNYIPNPNAVVTQGQLKQFTARAVDEFNTELPGGAGPALSNLVYGWHQDYATNNYAGTNNPYAPHKPSDLNAMTVGQLKYIGNTVYGRLSAAGYTNLAPSWLARNTNSDNSVAVLGQLKEVFDFDFSLPSASNFTATSGASGTVNLSWSASTNNVAPWVVEEQVPDGSWTFLTTLPSTAESYAVTGLTSGQGYTFQVFANGTNNVSAIASASTLLTSFPSSGLAVWLKADVGLSQSGGVVTGWTDQSLSHNDASPSSVPPTVTTDSNGFHVVHFDGSGNNFLTIADNPTVDPNTFTILVAAKDYGPDNSQYIICRPYRSTGDFGGWTSPYMSYAAKLSESSTTFQGGGRNACRELLHRERQCQYL